jgi:hypothetical protein
MSETEQLGIVGPQVREEVELCIQERCAAVEDCKPFDLSASTCNWG